MKRLDIRPNFVLSGQPTDLYDFHSGDGIRVLKGVGLGGGSLVNANVSIQQNSHYFKKPEWPQGLKEDIGGLYDVDAAHAREMLQPSVWPAPPDYVEPKKMKAMEKAVEGIYGVDIEDLGKFIKKVPLYVSFFLSFA